MTVHTGHIHTTELPYHFSGNIVPAIEDGIEFAGFDQGYDSDGGLLNGALIDNDRSHPVIAHSAFQGRTFVEDFYNRIHVVPNILQMGIVLGQQVQQVTVFNAYLTAQTLSSVTEVDTDGISLEAPDSIPLAFQPLVEKVWTVTIGTNGPTVIDASATFNFPSDSPALLLTGTRSVIVPFPPDWTDEVVEELVWYTAIFESESGKERRSARVLTPRKSLDYQVELFGTQLPTWFDNALFGQQNNNFGVPVWHDETPLTALVNPGSETIYLDTRYYQFSSASVVLLYHSPDSYETATISQVFDDHLTLQLPLSTGWNAGTPVFPVQTGRLDEQINFDRGAEQWGSFPLKFRMDPTATDPVLGGGSASDTHEGLEVWTKRPNWSENISHGQTFRTAVMDGEWGPWSYLPARENAKRQFGIPYLFFDREQALAYRQFLGRAVGRRGAFFVPSWTNDLTVVEDLGPSGTVLRCVNNGYTVLSPDNPYKENIYVETIWGTYHFLTLTGTSLDPETNVISFSFSTATGEAIDVSEFKLVCWLYKVRLSTDSLRITWLTPRVSTAILPLEVIEE